MELYCGIDVSKGEHTVCMKNERLENMDRMSITNNIHGFKKLEERIPKQATIGMEATGEYHKPLESWLKEKGYTVYVFNPRKTKNLANVDNVAIKTDPVDAAMLAEFMAKGFHKTQKQWNNKYPELRHLTRARIALVNDNIRLKIRVLTRLAVVFPEYETLFAVHFKKTFNELLLKYTTPENFAKLSAEQLTAEIIPMSMGLFREKKA